TGPFLRRSAPPWTGPRPPPSRPPAVSLLADALTAPDSLFGRGAILGTPSAEPRHAAQGGRPARRRSPRIPHANPLSPAARTTLAGYHRRFPWSIVSASVHRDP